MRNRLLRMQLEQLEATVELLLERVQEELNSPATQPSRPTSFHEALGMSHSSEPTPIDIESLAAHVHLLSRSYESALAKASPPDSPASILASILGQ